MSVLIVGANGSMGRRYQAILKYLKKDFWCVDKDHSRDAIHEIAKESSGIIIASPTETHVKYLDELTSLGQPVLCEKPISKNKDEIDFIRGLEKNFTMMFQYSILDSSHFSGHTYYNFFKHGNDGLYWDCIQPIGLARSTVEINETSPIWKCRLNGKRLSLADMDSAYVEFVRSWFRTHPAHPIQDRNEIIGMHYKVMEMEKNGKTN